MLSDHLWFWEHHLRAVSFQINDDRRKKNYQRRFAILNSLRLETGMKNIRSFIFTGNSTTHLVSCKVFAGMVILPKEKKKKKILLTERYLSFKPQTHLLGCARSLMEAGQAGGWTTGLEANGVLSSPSNYWDVSCQLSCWYNLCCLQLSHWIFRFFHCQAPPPPQKMEKKYFGSASKTLTS